MSTRNYRNHKFIVDHRGRLITGNGFFSNILDKAKKLADVTSKAIDLGKNVANVIKQGHDLYKHIQGKGVDYFSSLPGDGLSISRGKGVDYFSSLHGDKLHSINNALKFH